VILPRYHATAAGSTALIALVVIGFATLEHRSFGDADEGPALDDLKVMEVSVARPAKPNKQPQKQHRDPVHQVDQGVAHDDKKKPDDPKPKPDNPKPKPDDDKDGPAAKPGDDEPIGKPTSDVGDFNPNKFGNADVDKGDPYLRDVVKDVLSGWEFPKILEATGVPLGCVRLDADGKVVDTLFKTKSGNGDLDDSVERALKTFKETRNKSPQQVPTKLLEITTEWICFQFKV
jgi:hypothetical protein